MCLCLEESFMALQGGKRGGLLLLLLLLMMLLLWLLLLLLEYGATEAKTAMQEGPCERASRSGCSWSLSFFERASSSHLHAFEEILRSHSLESARFNSVRDFNQFSRVFNASLTSRCV